MEIERKFLINKDEWDRVQKPKPIRIIQGYIYNGPNTVRVRMKDLKSFLTVKSETFGISREEFEYEIPMRDANQMLEKMCPKQIIKDRYEIVVGKHKWEVDVFHRDNSGLIIAEIELESEKEEFELPIWITEEVSHDSRYYNSNLVNNPYKEWFITDKKYWKQVRNNVKTFEFLNEPQYIHIIETGFPDEYMIVYEDADEVMYGTVVFKSKEQIKEFYNIDL